MLTGVLVSTGVLGPVLPHRRWFLLPHREGVDGLWFVPLSPRGALSTRLIWCRWRAPVVHKWGQQHKNKYQPKQHSHMFTQFIDAGA